MRANVLLKPARYRKPRYPALSARPILCRLLVSQRDDLAYGLTRLVACKARGPEGAQGTAKLEAVCRQNVNLELAGIQANQTFIQHQNRALCLMLRGHASQSIVRTRRKPRVANAGRCRLPRVNCRQPTRPASSMSFDRLRKGSWQCPRGNAAPRCPACRAAPPKRC